MEGGIVAELLAPLLGIAHPLAGGGQGVGIAVALAEEPGQDDRPDGLDAGVADPVGLVALPAGLDRRPQTNVAAGLGEWTRVERRHWPNPDA
jgi:hypothetical protein